MGQLRDKMAEDLALRGLRQGTRDNYLRCAREFAAYHRRSPAAMGAAEIRGFLLHLLTERKLAPSTVGVHIGALRFLYEVTLKRPDEVHDLFRPKRVQRLPDVLSTAEVEQLLAAVRSLKHRAIIMTAYGAGLRVSEVCRLKVTDIDSQRMLIHIREAKGAKDRYVILAEQLLSVLRAYWRAVRPSPPYLFPGGTPGHPITTHGIARMLRRAAKRSGLKKRVSPHVLRHSFATQLLEDGHDVLTIQRLLGHSSIKTSVRYIHVTAKHLGRVVSPLAKLRLPQPEHGT